MKMMERAGAIPALMLLALMMTSGCSPPPDQRDQRLADLAEKMTDQQARQNEKMADQSKAVVEESGKVAEAARDLVGKDAEARREMIVATKELQSEVHAERASVHRQRDDLENDRRTIAAQRHRDPIIGESIRIVGLVLACLVPMLLAGYLLHTLRRTSSDDSETVSELLVQEITSSRPRLLPAPAHPAVEQHGLPPGLPDIGDTGGQDVDRDVDENDDGPSA